MACPGLPPEGALRARTDVWYDSFGESMQGKWPHSSGGFRLKGLYVRWAGKHKSEVATMPKPFTWDTGAHKVVTLVV